MYLLNGCPCKQLPEIVMVREGEVSVAQPVTQGQSLIAVLVVLIFVLIVSH